MDDLLSPVGIIALAAGAVALGGLVVSAVLAGKLRRMRAAQLTVLGGHEQRDLVHHASRLEAAFVELRESVEDSVARLEDRVDAEGERMDGCLAYHALVRYDAYGEMSGRQSRSVALLDFRRSGVVLSTIHHRDQARIYIKPVHEGQSEFELSPEEQEAIDLALSSGQVSAGG